MTTNEIKEGLEFRHYDGRHMVAMKDAKVTIDGMVRVWSREWRRFDPIMITLPQGESVKVLADV